MSWERLRVLLAVVEAGSLARAAERLGVSAPAVSQALRRLETEVGVPLLRRTSRSMALTPEGAVLADRARVIADLLDEALRAPMTPAEPPRPQLRLGCTEDIAERLLPAALAALAARKDGPQVSLLTARGPRLEALFRRGELDAVLFGRPPAEPRPLDIPLWREPLRWVGDGTGRRPLPLIAIPEGCMRSQAAMAALKSASLAWRPETASNSLVGVWAALRAGVGVAALPASTLPPDLAPADAPELPALPDYEFVALAGGPRERRWLEPLVEGLRAAARQRPGERAQPQVAVI